MINDGEEVGEPIELRKRTNQVHMNIREPPSRQQSMMNWRLHMTLDLTLLAVEARLSPCLHPSLETPVAGKHTYQDEKRGGWSQTLLFSQAMELGDSGYL